MSNLSQFLDRGFTQTPDYRRKMIESYDIEMREKEAKEAQFPVPGIQDINKPDDKSSMMGRAGKLAPTQGRKS